MNQKKYEELELRDDFMFSKVMGNREICHRTLEVLLGVPIDGITYPETQKSIDVIYHGRGVRLDVYVTDGHDAVYNAEMQNLWSTDTRKQLPMRSRYYSSMIDINQLEKGESYERQEDSYILFLCTFDPFGMGKCQYTFQNVCKEDKSLILQDGVTRIFYNTTGDMAEVSEELRKYLQYIETGRAESDLTRQIDREVKRVRHNEKWKVEYMKAYLDYCDAKRIGRAEGEKIGQVKGERRLLINFLKNSTGYSDEEIAGLLGISPKEVAAAKLELQDRQTNRA